MYFKVNEDGTGGTLSTKPSMRDLEKEVENLRARVAMREQKIAESNDFAKFVHEHNPELLTAWKVSKR